MPYSYQYPHMAVTVDAVVFSRGATPKVLLIKRARAPHKGCWAIPGGFVDLEETCLNAARRELHEETGLRDVELRFLHYFDAVDRDPRERTLSLVFWGLVDESAMSVSAADDASEVDWFVVDKLPKLAFDHAAVLARAIRELHASGS